MQELKSRNRLANHAANQKNKEEYRRTLLDERMGRRDVTRGKAEQATIEVRTKENKIGERYI